MVLLYVECSKENASPQQNVLRNDILKSGCQLVVTLYTQLPYVRFQRGTIGGNQQFK